MNGASAALEVLGPLLIIIGCLAAAAGEALAADLRRAKTRHDIIRKYS